MSVKNILILKTINGETIKIFLSKSVENLSAYNTQREEGIPDEHHPIHTLFFLWKFWKWN